MKKSVLVLIVILSLVMTMFIACARQPRADAPVTITVSTFAGDPYQFSWRTMFDRFQNDTGVTVIQDAVPWGNLREKQILELSGGGTYDVVYVHPFWFEDLASNGFLLPIDDYTTSAERAMFVDTLLELYEYNGSIYGLPDWITTQLLAYRKDLFDRAGLSAPKTWNDILHAAEVLSDGSNMYGVTFPGRPGGSLAGMFMAFILSNEGWLLDSNGMPAVNSQAGIETAEFMLRLSRYAPPGYQNFFWEESSNVAMTGRAAMAFKMTSFVGWLEDPARSETVGLWAFAPVSNKTEGGMIDSYCWSVVRGTRHLDTAARLVKFMADTEVQIFLTEQIGTAGATRAYYDNPALAAEYPFLEVMNLAFRNAAPQPSWSTWSAEQEVLERGLHDLFNDRTNARTMLDAVQARMMERFR